MKLQIDTENKTIKIEEAVNIDKFIKMVKKLFPNNEWKEYELEVGTITYWTNPYPIIYPLTYPTDPYPWWQPTTISESTTITTGSTYCLDVKIN